MCGRFMIAKQDQIEAHFRLAFPELSGGRYNVAPTQDVPVIRDRDGSLAGSMLRWGLAPSWSKEPKVSFSNINARCETVATSAAYRAAFKSRRCLMPADGFYECLPGPPKVPHLFRLPGGEPFAFAGLWERWHKGEEQEPPLETCALVTTEANEVVAPVHARMPVILHPSDYALWLDPKASIPDLIALLRSYDGPMTAAVGPYVNSPKNQGPRCAGPV